MFDVSGKTFNDNWNRSFFLFLFSLSSPDVLIITACSSSLLVIILLIVEPWVIAFLFVEHRRWIILRIVEAWPVLLSKSIWAAEEDWKKKASPFRHKSHLHWRFFSCRNTLQNRSLLHHAPVLYPHLPVRPLPQLLARLVLLDWEVVALVVSCLPWRRDPLCCWELLGNIGTCGIDQIIHMQADTFETR